MSFSGARIGGPAKKLLQSKAERTQTKIRDEQIGEEVLCGGSLGI